jgi:hypothetical protein
MPLLQYFGWVEAFLLAMLFAANWCFSGGLAHAPPPEVPLNQKISTRIHSQHKWPERVVFDTSRPRSEPAATVVAETNVRPSQKLAQARGIDGSKRWQK